MINQSISVDIKKQEIAVKVENANIGYLHKTIDIVYIIDAGADPITPGVKGYLAVPFPCSIVQWDIYADQPGSIEIDIVKDTYANFPPSLGNSICGGVRPSLINTQKNRSTDLAVWTTTIASDEILGFRVLSANYVKKITLSLKVIRS